jgi:hypothetical protein
MNLSLNHLPDVADAYINNGSIVFPVALFNGALPLIMMHVGESGSRAAVILDTASEQLLLGDVERCESCSTDMFGGARGSDSENDPRHGSGIVQFKTQKDHVEYRVEDVYIDEFNIPQLKFGLVTRRENLTQETTTTYNILGLGGAQTIPDAMLNQMHTRLRKGKHRVFGFMLGQTGNDQVDQHGYFVLGPIPRPLLDATPIVQIPLHRKPTSPYYYTCHAEQIIAHLRNNTSVVYNLKNFPVMFDTGSNYSHMPLAIEQYFPALDRLEFVFPGNNRLMIPNSGLMWNKTPSSPLVRFSHTTILTIGTIILSKFKAIEFHLDPVPHVDFYTR